MFNTLLESKAKRQKSTGGTVASVFIHVALIMLIVTLTARAGEIVEERRQEDVKFMEVEQPKEAPPEPEQPKAPPPPDVAAAPPPPKGFQTLQAPIDIPTVIPDIDLTRQVTREEDFSGRGRAGGIAAGVEGGTGPVTDQPYFDFQVEKPAMAVPGGSSPRYPDLLRNANVEGRVIAEFVVDTNGRADMSQFRVIESSHDLFTNSVRQHLPSMRFMAAETGGRKVRMWVQMPFNFQLQR